MADLSHWDFADEFTAQEAASLILGVDPMIDGEAVRAKPIFEKFRSSYQCAWGYWHTRCDGDFEFNEDAKLPDVAIQSVAMLSYVGMFVQPGLTEQRKEFFCRWVGWETSEDGEFSGFLHQRFSRQEITLNRPGFPRQTRASGNIASRTLQETGHLHGYVCAWGCKTFRCNQKRLGEPHHGLCKSFA